MESRNKNKIFLSIASIITFTFFIVAIVSIFFTQKTDKIQREKNLLIQDNLILQKSIQKKEEQHALMRDRIGDVQELVNSKNIDNKNINKILKTLSKKSKNLIIDSLPSGYPLKSKRITSEFGYRIHPVHGTKRFHHGLDFGGKLGTPIISTADGIVEFSGFNKGYGNLVMIHHNFGFKTAYGHMLQNLEVKKGDFVKKGDVIGYLGNTGISTGPHLHYEVKYIKNVINPKIFLSINIDNFDKTLKGENSIPWKGLIGAVMNQYGRIGLARLL